MKLKRFGGFPRFLSGYEFVAGFFALCLMSAHTYRFLGGSSVAGGPFSATGGGPRPLIDDLGPPESKWKTSVSAVSGANEN